MSGGGSIDQESTERKGGGSPFLLFHPFSLYHPLSLANVNVENAMFVREDRFGVGHCLLA